MRGLIGGLIVFGAFYMFARDDPKGFLKFLAAIIIPGLILGAVIGEMKKDARELERVQNPNGVCKARGTIFSGFSCKEWHK